MNPSSSSPGTPGSSPASPGMRRPRWHSRGDLPHFDGPGIIQSITLRLADSLPKAKLDRLADELQRADPARVDQLHRQKIETWLDSGMGCCALRHPEIAKAVQDAFLYHDNERYRLLAWCIMPNHVHVLVQPLIDLSKIIQSWKSFTGRLALRRNAELELGVPGPGFWMRDYWDRYIRDQAHLDAVIGYIHANPVSAGLVDSPEVWPWSSASLENDNLSRL